MTLDYALAPLAAHAVLFQTVVYVALPRRRRTALMPVVTGVVGAGITVAAGQLFGWETIGLGGPLPEVVAGWGVATVAFMSLIGLVMYLVDRLRSLLADPRLANLTRAQAFLQIAVRIPVMTALIEEAFFRGVLHAALMALYPPQPAMLAGALLFGVWHVAPGFDQVKANGGGGMSGVLHVLATVAVTSLAGAGLVWLRVETGSIWAPFVVHAAINMTMAVFARAAGRAEQAA